jgi:hypothetical protein
MNSEWMKVMLDEIARKKAEMAQSRIEVERRAGMRVETGEYEIITPPEESKGDCSA